MGKFKIEICANSVESALMAQKGGADRVELCTGIAEGGITPSIGEVSEAKDSLSKTLMNVMIRPRGGDFCYSPHELRAMENDILVMCLMPIHGFVFGCLTPAGDVDMKAMRRLMKRIKVKGKGVTFHRAFDMCRNPFQALEDIIALGCERILTSGLQATAEEGIPLIKKLVEQAAGRIVIMPGCGITPQNIRKIAEETGATEFHFSGRHAVGSPMQFRNPHVSMGGTDQIDEYSRLVTDPAMVKAAWKALNR
ncbi:MAG: copper homeostasis protein CutC [Bacteroidaceae bacterium]|nr:copper homeostasis protein CutC [Bacteroidaceae bacterium]